MVGNTTTALMFGGQTSDVPVRSSSTEK